MNSTAATGVKMYVFLCIFDSDICSDICVPNQTEFRVMKKKTFLIPFWLSFSSNSIFNFIRNEDRKIVFCVLICSIVLRRLIHSFLFLIYSFNADQQSIAYFPFSFSRLFGYQLFTYTIIMLSLEFHYFLFFCFFAGGFLRVKIQFE